MISEAAKENRRERDRIKKQRRRARLKAQKLQVLTFSKTSPQYRRLLGPAPEMTKSELRAVITAAVRNTQPGASA